VIGTVASQSGPFASAGVGINEFEQAWAKWVNTEKGGINGHPVKVIVVDDASAASAGVAAVQGLVNQDHVIALVGGYATNSETAFASYLQQQKIPDIGSAPYTPAWTQNPVFYPVTMTVPDSLYSKASLAKQEGAKHWGALVCAESPACDVSAQWATESKTLGLPYAGALKVSASAANYTAECLNMMQQHVDYVQIGDAPAVVDRVIQNCQQQGYNPKYGVTTVAWDPSFLKLGNVSIYGDSFAMPWFIRDSATANFDHIASTYIHDNSWQGSQVAATFSALEVFRQAMSTVTAAHPTGVDVMRAMTTLHDDNLGGLLANSIGGYNAGTGPQPALKCFFVAEITGGHESAPNGVKPVCNPR
jgi:branched-chain amino acid transport system substrate-binding protein